MNSEEVKLLIDDAVRRAVRPLEDEIHALRLEVARLKGASQVVSGEPENTVPDAKNETSSPNPESQIVSSQPALSVPDSAVEVPPERTDFARFLQRGLEQEAQEYTEDKMKDADTKKKPGWNPFKR
jgi:hypothetical protein